MNASNNDNRQEAALPEQDVSEVRKVRQSKLDALRETGKDPFQSFSPLFPRISLYFFSASSAISRSIFS